MLQKYLQILFWLFIICFIVSCDKTENISGPEPPNENILRIDVPASFNSLNPADVDAGATVIFPLLYSYLFVPDENGELQPDLAESWTYDPEAFSWIIHLRTDALFHNGRPVTSKDVKYSILTVLKNSNAAMMDSIKEIFPVSDNKLCVYMINDAPDFMEKIWTTEIFPEPEDKFAQEKDLPVGSGPFKCISRDGNEQVVLKANNNYFQHPPSLDKVVYYYQPDREKSWTRLLSGKTDIAFGISPENVEIMKQYDKRFYFDRYILEDYSIILYNTNDALFSEPKVRQALTHAIDRDYIVNHLLDGYGKVAAGPMGIDSPYHNPDVVPLSYDPQKSLELLRQAGWELTADDHYLHKDKKRFEFVLTLLEEFQVERKIARYIKLCLNEIGIKMTVQTIPTAEYRRTCSQNTDFQAVFNELPGAYNRPEFLIELWTPYVDEKSRAGCFAYPAVTELFNQAIHETDPVQKKNFFQKADAAIASLQPGTFLFHKIAVDVMSRRFFLPERFSLDYEGLYRLKDISLIQN